MDISSKIAQGLLSIGRGLSAPAGAVHLGKRHQKPDLLR